MKRSGFSAAQPARLRKSLGNDFAVRNNGSLISSGVQRSHLAHSSGGTRSRQISVGQRAVPLAHSPRRLHAPILASRVAASADWFLRMRLSQSSPAMEKISVFFLLELLVVGSTHARDDACHLLPLPHSAFFSTCACGT